MCRTAATWALAWVGLGLITASNGLLASGQEQGPEATPEPVTLERMRGWIEQLDSDSFADREAASHALARYGGRAIALLTEAADGRRAEVARRAVAVLSELCRSADEATAQAALAALESICKSSHRLAARRAYAALELQRWLAQQQAIEDLEELGATIESGVLTDGEWIVYSVVMGRKWTGGEAGLAHLKWLAGLKRLSLYGPQFTDATVDHLPPLVGLEMLQAYGTELTDKGEEALRARFPVAAIDRRQGGMLGVRGLTHAKGCEIQSVQPGSAADQAGIKAGDVIRGIDGEPVADFPALVATIATKRPGEEIRVEFERGGRTLTRKAVLGELESLEAR